MKKKLGILLMTLSLSLGTIAPVYAAMPQDSIMPCYEDIDRLYGKLTVSDEGEAYYKVEVYTASSKKIKIDIEIQQKINGKWKGIYQDSKTGTKKSLTLCDTTDVNSSGEYRMKYTVEVTYGTANDVETVTKYVYA